MINKLTELIKEAMQYADNRKDIGELYKPYEEYIAEYLLDNNTIVTPCKVGQILYVVEAGLINEAKVKEYKYCSNSNNDVHWHIIFEELFAMSEAHIGKSVFYTREEAEKALKEGAE